MRRVTANTYRARDNGHSIHDPPLTDLGVQQCEALRDSLRARLDDMLLKPSDVAVIASPMRRTLQTAQLCTDWLLEAGVKIVAWANLQENSDQPCDTGSTVHKMQAEFPDVDFSTVDPVWPDKTSPAGQRYAYTRKAVLSRGQGVLKDLSQRPEKLVLVVSHSAFLRLGVAGFWWMNADYRIFHLADRGTDRVEIEQDESTLLGGLGLSWREPVELGSGLPEE